MTWGFWVRSTKAAQFSGRGARLVQTFDMSRRDNGTNKSNNIVKDRITMWKRLSSMQLDIMLRKATRRSHFSDVKRVGYAAGLVVQYYSDEL